MSDDIQSIGIPYEGQNEAHRKFRAEFRYLNALYYLILSGQRVLQGRLVEAVNECVEQERRALFVVTHGISTTQFQGVIVPRDDAAAMATDFNVFLDLVNKHCIIAAHRALVDYVFDLLIEIDKKAKLAISPEKRDQLLNRRANPSELVQLLYGNALPLTTDPQLEVRCKLLAETRNCLEHNAGSANAAWCAVSAGSSVKAGDLVPATAKEVGEAFALIQAAASSLNQRAMQQFNL